MPATPPHDSSEPRNDPRPPASPHDAVFRSVLGIPANAASQLRAILPADLTARLDLDQLTPLPGTLVAPDLRTRHTDLLFTAPLDDADAYLYLLIEHQSTTDPLMAFRMLAYVVKIWDHHLAQHPHGDRLPAVIPVVIHHNHRPWTAPTELTDLIDIDTGPDGAGNSVIDYLPSFRFLLDDLAQIDSSTLRDRPLTPATRLTLLLLQIARGNTRLAQDLQPWTDQLRAVLDDRALFRALLSYIGSVGETPPDQFQDLFARLGPDAEEDYMTTFDMLRTEGHTAGLAEGREAGRAEGREAGRAEGRAEALIDLLTARFQAPTPAQTATIRAATPAQLSKWTTNVLDATSIDEALS